jgi:hypothetical protein
VVNRTGLAEGMSQAKITRPATDLVALLIFCLVFLSFMLMSLENLGWAMAVILLQSFISYLPRLLAVILVLVAGALLVQIVGQAVQATVASMDVEFHEGIGKAVRGLLLVVTAIIAVEQIGIQRHTFDRYPHEPADHPDSGINVSLYPGRARCGSQCVGRGLRS